VTVHIVSWTKLSRGRLADGPGKRFLSLKPALQVMSISPPLFDVNLVCQPHGFPLRSGWGAVRGGQLGSMDSYRPVWVLLYLISCPMSSITFLFLYGLARTIQFLRCAQSKFLEGCV
jgi:hypothetical protein